MKMSKDPRNGLKLRLGYEVAREIERTPVIAPGVSDAAVRAVSSVLYQRLQDQIIDDNPTAQILEERIRDINITNIASENNINKADLIAVLQSGGFQGPPGDKGDKGDPGDQGPPGLISRFSSGKRSECPALAVFLVKQLLRGRCITCLKLLAIPVDRLTATISDRTEQHSFG